MPAKSESRPPPGKAGNSAEKRFFENDAGTTSFNIGTSSSKPAFPGAASPFKKKGEKDEGKEETPFSKSERERGRKEPNIR